MSEAFGPEPVLTRSDRAVFFGVLGVMLAIAAIAWFGTWLSAQGMTSGMMVMMATQSGWDGFAFFLAVWSVMMVAMMFPAAAPMVRAFVSLSKPDGTVRNPWWSASTAAFLSVYVLVWASVGVAVAAAYLLLTPRSDLLGMTGTLGPGVAGALLIVAGIYQTTPLKQTCLAGCRSPVTFLVRYWRTGLRGVLGLGLRHAAYCLGCCALLFVVLFAVGIMALPWMAFLAAVIFVEKGLPVGHWASFAFGGLFVILGASFLLVPGWGSYALGIA